MKWSSGGVGRRQVALWPLAARGLVLSLALAVAAQLVAAQPQAQVGGVQELPADTGTYPYYMQSPIQTQHQQAPEQLNRRATIPTGTATPTPVPYGDLKPATTIQANEQPQRQQQQAPNPNCLYERRHFARFDQCLERKPYPTIGLPAFKNDDLMVHQRATSGHLADRHGCSFILTNGLFKHYQLSKYAIDTSSSTSDSKCLDSDNKPLQLSMQFHNVTLYYLWQLRCLNQANQLLDDATLNGRTATVEQQQQQQGSSSDGAPPQRNTFGSASNSICVGSSQNFGFASLQVSNIETQVELAMDIYKNWRVTNITLAMLPTVGAKLGGGDEHAPHTPPTTNIRDFTFETLDGDELNWRYLALYENWTRNKLHTNFLEQFKRFVWISLQRCLSESSDKLPVKLVELFGQQRYS